MDAKFRDRTGSHLLEIFNKESFMFSSQLYNQNTSWEEIKSVLEVMESGRWESAYFYDHFVPPWHTTR